MIAFLIAIVALLVITVAWGATMNLGSKDVPRSSSPRPRARRRA